MGLKVNRQTDMDKLFDQFASIPTGKLQPGDVDTNKAKKDADREAAYAKFMTTEDKDTKDTKATKK